MKSQRRALRNGMAFVFAGMLATAFATEAFSQSRANRPGKRLTFQSVQVETFTVFGPRDYVHEGGPPVTFTETFEVLNPGAFYFIRMTDLADGIRSARRAARPQLLLNGARLVRSRAAVGGARQRIVPGGSSVIGLTDTAVALRADNELTITLAGAAGSGITLEVIGIDDAPPSITAIADPAPNSAGWNNTAVTVRFECADTASGVAACPDPVTVQTEGAGQTVRGTALDNVGHSASASLTLNIDRTPPQLTLALVDDAACRAADGLTGRVADALSGPAEVSCNGAPTALSDGAFACDAPPPGAAQSIDVEAVDVAGNTSTRTIRDAALELVYVDQFELRWWDVDSGAIFDGAFYAPIVPDGYHALGHYGQGDFGVPRGFTFAARELEAGALAAPTGYQQIWNDVGSGADLDGSMWQPLCPEGYASIGVVAQRGYSQPATDEVRCVRQDLVLPGKVGNQIYNDRESGGDQDIGAWQIVPDDDDGIFIGAFTAIRNLFAVPTGDVFVIDANAVKKSFQGCTSHAPGPDQVDAMVQDFGPVIRLHPHEKYLMDDPEHTLDTVTDLTWGHVQNESDFDTFSSQINRQVETSSASLMRDVADLVETDPDAGDVDFRHWLHLNLGQPAPIADSGATVNPGLPLPSGDLARAKVFVHSRQWNHLFTELQFWVFYPFNGPGKWRLQVGDIDTRHVEMSTAGRHYGDWEQVTLRIANDPRQLAAINLSRHDFAEWVTSTQFGSRIQFEGTHPIVYSARDSHAHYPTPGDQYYKRVAHTSIVVGHIDVDLKDLTADGGPEFESFLPGNYLIVATEESIDEEGVVQERVVIPDWLNFKGRWGQYERLEFSFTYDVFGIGLKTERFEEVGAGPSGPPQKGVWKRGPSSQKFWWTRNLETDEICHDGIDNDGDGWTDEADADCHQTEPASRLSGQCAFFPFRLFDDPRAGTTCENKCFEKWSGAGWSDC